MENLYKNKVAPKRRFSISVPRASYISDAFARFSRRIGPEPSEIFYNETNTSQAISNILMADYRLGIIRYPRQHDKYFKSLLREKGLSCELITEFRPQLLMHRDCPLNQKGEIFFKDLEPHIEVAHSDAYVPPAIPLSAVRKEEPPDNISRRIFVFERAGQFELLCANPETFMWVSPVPQTQLERYGLVQRTCRDDQRIYRDLLIYRADYEMTPWDNTFLEELRQAQKTHIPPPANVNES